MPGHYFCDVEHAPCSFVMRRHSRTTRNANKTHSCLLDLRRRLAFCIRGSIRHFFIRFFFVSLLSGFLGLLALLLGLFGSLLRRTLSSRCLLSRFPAGFFLFLTLVVKALDYRSCRGAKLIQFSNVLRLRSIFTFVVEPILGSLLAESNALNI